MSPRYLVLTTRAIAAFGLSAALAAPRTANAQPVTTLDDARALFKEAVTDEDDFQRFDAALSKFRRVLAYKDSVNVRYRIGTCLEQLGQYAAAFEAFEAALSLGAGEPESDVFRASQQHAAAVGKRVAKVVLLLSPRAPKGAEVRVDDRPLTAQAMREPIVLDPGHHTFVGTAADVPPFRASLTLSEGSQISLTIALDRASPPRDTAPGGTGGEAKSSTHLAGWITLAAGGALLAGGGVFALLQRSAVDDLDTHCEGGTCPTSEQSSLSSERSRALAYEPLSVGLAAAGFVAAGVGLYFILKSDVVVAPTAGGVSVRGAF